MMLNIPDELLEVYADELAVAESSFEIMGKLLDRGYLKKRLEGWHLEEIYIYGGGYIGIQFYYACEKLARILSVVDKQGHLRLDLAGIPVTGLEGLKKVYKGEHIIITPVRYYQEIREDLLAFVPESKIIFIGELLGGISQ